MMIIPVKLKSRKLSDEVRDLLLLHIQENRLAPGTTLPSERELMASYNVGRPVIREAMQSLQHIGLVTIRHGERPKVSEPALSGMIGQFSESIKHLLMHSEDSLDNLKDARLLLESHVAELAAENRTEDDISKLETIVDTQASHSQDTTQFLEQDQLFHIYLAKISQNSIYETLVTSLFEWMKIFHRQEVRAEGLEELTIQEHREIILQIKNQDSAAAAKIMKTHLRRSNAEYHRNIK